MKYLSYIQVGRTSPDEQALGRSGFVTNPANNMAASKTLSETE